MEENAGNTTAPFFVAARAVTDRPHLFGIASGASPLDAINEVLFATEGNLDADDARVSVWRLDAESALTPSEDMRLLSLCHFSLRSFLTDVNQQHPEYQTLWRDARFLGVLHRTAIGCVRAFLADLHENHGAPQPTADLWEAVSAAADRYIAQTFGERP